MLGQGFSQYSPLLNLPNPPASAPAGYVWKKVGFTWHLYPISSQTSLQQQSQQNLNLQNKLADDTGMKNGSGADDGAGLFGFDTTTLIIIGIALIAVIYFVKK